MVKVKEGYIMSPAQKAQYERDDARPRKSWGKVNYYFKPQTKYPPRIYVFMHAEIWCDRNRRPMGLFHALPFLSRPMNKQEIEYHHFDTRLCYHQYEDWDKLIYAEEKEAEELDRETPGSGTGFLTRLIAFRQKYPLGGDMQELPPVPEPSPEPLRIKLELEEDPLLKELEGMGHLISAASLSSAMKMEQEIFNRKPVLVALHHLYRQAVLPEKDREALNIAAVKRKAELSEAQTRRNYVRRVYGKNKLFALAEISERYTGYTMEMLWQDIHIKKRKPKRKKQKPVLDLRRVQLQKLAFRLKNTEMDDAEYDKTCQRMALLQEAHHLRLPIPLTVNLDGETLVYSFNWKTRETVVKSFVETANTRGMTHELLKARYQEIISSPYSF